MDHLVDAPLVSDGYECVTTACNTLQTRSCKHLEVDSQQHAADSSSRVSNIVYVLNMRGNPISPTTSAKARKLLKKGRAVVVQTRPFVIKLCYQTGEARHSNTLLLQPETKEVVNVWLFQDNKCVLAKTWKLRYKQVQHLLRKRKSYRRARRKHSKHKKTNTSNNLLSFGHQYFSFSVVRLYSILKQLVDITSTKLLGSYEYKPTWSNRVAHNRLSECDECASVPELVNTTTNHLVCRRCYLLTVKHGVTTSVWLRRPNPLYSLLHESLDNPEYTHLDQLHQNLFVPDSELLEVRRNNRSLEKRVRDQVRVRKQRYKLQPHSIVTYNNNKYRVKGVFSYGAQVRTTCLKTGKTVNLSTTKCKLYKYERGLVFL